MVTAAAVATALAVIATPANASQPQLTRYPYLTDAVTTGATLNPRVSDTPSLSRVSSQQMSDGDGWVPVGIRTPTD